MLRYSRSYRNHGHHYMRTAHQQVWFRLFRFVQTKLILPPVPLKRVTKRSSAPALKKELLLPNQSISVALSLLETEVGKRSHWCHTIHWSYRYPPPCLCCSGSDAYRMRGMSEESFHEKCVRCFSSRRTSDLYELLIHLLVLCQLSRICLPLVTYDASIHPFYCCWLWCWWHNTSLRSIERIKPSLRSEH